MSHDEFNLAATARQVMIEEGFRPDFPDEAHRQLAGIHPQSDSGLRDLTALLWSSIDNDDSRDLDQIEWAERVDGGIRVLVGVADVDSAVPKGSPLDDHAAREATTVYAAVRTFPMLPEQLSTDMTSLNENQNREAVVLEFMVPADGQLGTHSVYRAMVRNRAQLTYNGVGAWLEGTAGPPPKVAASPDLAAQLKLQDEAALALRGERDRLGALRFDRIEPEPVLQNGNAVEICARHSNRAAHLIEDFMIAANEVMARTLRDAGVPSIRRIVKTPERWQRMVDLAHEHGDTLPPEPDSGALNALLMRRKKADPDHYPDISLAILKLMGPGEYVLLRPGEPEQGHFGLAAHDYTHSTAPNRRFADLLTQRLLKALPGTPYSDAELDAAATNCTLKEDAARKVRRAMDKRLAAAALHDRVGQSFSAVVTGATSKGVFVRVLGPPVEGRLMRGEEGLDVGDRLHVKLLSTDPRRGFIDFGRI
ncbi:MAG TPA: RNB domain-containing ribonuclease [Bryobacteraceae bacterium]|nr:RNB domain-containing ribonuclease [Bryobacteraceae bacterium]